MGEGKGRRRFKEDGGLGGGLIARMENDFLIPKTIHDRYMYFAWYRQDTELQD